MLFPTLREAQLYLRSQGFSPTGNKARGWSDGGCWHAFVHDPGIPSQGVETQVYVPIERHDARVTELLNAVNAEVERRREAEAAYRNLVASIPYDAIAAAARRAEAWFEQAADDDDVSGEEDAEREADEDDLNRVLLWLVRS